jgi:transcriptional regulator of acetoin/glycerol metabolism
VDTDSTRTLPDDVRSPSKPASGWSLAVILDADHPLASPVCVSLAGVEQVTLGRGPAFRVAETAPRCLHVELADEAMSSQHARLVQRDGDWELVDEHSKNGTFVNGRRIERCVLGAEHLIELGSLFFIVRRDVVPPVAGPPALRTLSAPLARELELFARVARSKVPIVLQGETGTGKEMLARAAHEASGRAGPFVAVNCGAIPAALVESELFGVRKGAFSGAHADRAGAVMAAHTGTLFLDEVAELPESSQAALLRVLQEAEVVPLGSTRPLPVDVRILAASHLSLGERVASGRFRNDLHARLKGHVLRLPPLRERRRDIGLLCAELLPRVAGARAAELRFQRAAARTLLTHDWPHNVRELEQVLARAMALLDGNEILVDHLPDDLVHRVAGAARADSGGAQLARLLRQHAGNLSAVARALTTSRSQVKRMVVRYGLDLAEFRTGPAAAADDDTGDDAG